MGGFRMFDLNPRQEEAVRHGDGPLLILAGAGTGKTRVITARIAYLVHQGVDPADILAVTFTNKAANEMRERVGGMVEREQASKLTLCTFHSLCVRVLRDSIERLGYKRNFTIYSESEQTGLLKKIIARTAGGGETLDHGLARFLIGRAKNDGIAAPPDGDDTLLAEVFRRYNDELLRCNAVDFDDLLLLAVRVLREHPDARAAWSARYGQILVDEFQDTNRLQLEIVQLLAGDPPNVCVVGDDDQSIYSWRGADVSNILEFERHFPNPRVITLEQNYRSTNAILSAANAVIRANARRRPKKLWSSIGGGGRIRLIPLPDDREEAALVVAEIQRMHGGEGAPFEDFAVLYRMNRQSRLIEEELRRHRIPYRLIGGKSFFDRREIRDLLAYATVLVNRDDDISLLRILNNPPRGIGEGTVKLAMAESTAARRPLREVLGDPAFLGRLSARAARAVGAFIERVAEYEARISEPLVDLAEVLGSWLADAGYTEALPGQCRSAEEAESRLGNIRGVLDDLREHQRRARAGLAGFLSDLALHDRRNEDERDKGSGVTLITLHAAKGLEFPHVFLIGVEEGLLPHERAKLEGSVDEERRLFYVGITRAMRTLTLTRSEYRTRYGEKVACLPSSFLADLGDGDIEHCDLESLRNARPSEREAEAHFASMREMILRGGS